MPTTKTLTGSGPIGYFVDGVGPTLADHGVENWLVDPQLTLFQGSTAIGTNDNWGSAANAAAIASAAVQAGAFSLPNGSRDAALLVDLTAGTYTAIASGTNGTTGVALVELYVVP